MCHFILWNCLSLGIESKSLWYDGVTHYQWNSVVQMGSFNGDSYRHCCIMYIQMSYTITSKQQVYRVLCSRRLGQFTGLCRWYGLTSTVGGKMYRLGCEKRILRSDEEKELVWCRREEQRKVVVKNFSQTFVKNALYFLWIRVL